jgi:F0F1-type ATP synthase membrane subunit b/b'
MPGVCVWHESGDGEDCKQRYRAKLNMEMLHQLEDLFLQSVPTIIIVLLFYVVLKYTFFQPLVKAMDERSARTEGARREAEESQAAAREKVHAYEEALKKARIAVYAEQDLARRVILDERANKVREARARAMELVQTQKSEIAKEVVTAMEQLEVTTPDLAAEMVRTLLGAQPGGSSPGQKPAGGAR